MPDEDARDETVDVFVIEDADYEVPSLADFTMGEHRVMYDYCGLRVEDFLDEDGQELPEEELDKLTGHPGFQATLMHVAYQRGNPHLSRQRVEKVIDRTRWLDAIAKLGDNVDEEASASPPPEASESDTPTRSSGESSPSSPPSGGLASVPTSASPDESRAPTGTRESGTPSISDQEISAA